MALDGYFWLEIAALILLVTAFVILLNAKKRDITNFLKHRLMWVFFLVVVFMIVFVVGFFISAIAILAFLVGFVLLLFGFMFSRKVEIRREIRLFRGKLEEENINPKVAEIKKEKSDVEKERNYLEKEKSRQEAKLVESKISEEKKRLSEEKKSFDRTRKEINAEKKKIGKIKANVRKKSVSKRRSKKRK